MERLKQILYKCMFPGNAVVVISIPVAAALLVYTFLFYRKEEPVAYISYVFSAYSLTIVILQIIKFVKKYKYIIYKNKYINRYLTDISFKMHVSLYMSLGINVLYVVMKLFYGVYYRSVWFGTLAVYYIMPVIMRFSLLRHIKRNAFGAELVSELKRYRICGVILMLMNVALTGVIVLVIRKNEGFEYPGYLIYVMAMYAFYNIITAVINVVKYRQYKSPVLSAAKVINLAIALVSMFSLEIAMLTQFENADDSPYFRYIMISSTGGAMCIFILGTAVFMIIKSTKQLKKLQSNEK